MNILTPSILIMWPHEDGRLPFPKNMRTNRKEVEMWRNGQPLRPFNRRSGEERKRE